MLFQAAEAFCDIRVTAAAVWISKSLQAALPTDVRFLSFPELLRSEREEPTSVRPTDSFDC